MILDLPELFAPARIVRGRIAMLCSSLMDLNPATWISAMAHGSTTVWLRAFAFLAICCLSCRMKQRLHCQAAPASGWTGRAGRLLRTADLHCVYWTASGLPRQCALRGEKKWVPRGYR